MASTGLCLNIQAVYSLEIENGPSCLRSRFVLRFRVRKRNCGNLLYAATDAQSHPACLAGLRSVLFIGHGYTPLHVGFRLCE